MTGLSLKRTALITWTQEGLSGGPAQTVVGSGYFVKDDLVLTAAHATPRSEAVDVDVRVEEGTPRWRRGGRVIWRDESIDAALIRVSPALAAPPARVRWLVDLPEEDVEWVSVGYPNAAALERLQGQDRKSSGLSGRLYVRGGGGPGTRELDLGIDDAASGESWSGISGAPVFVKGALAGLVKTVPTDFKGRRFNGTTAASLHELPGFRAALASGTSSLPSWPRYEPGYYVQRRVDDVVQRVIARPGRTLLVQGAPGHGKTRLLQRYAERCNEAGHVVVMINFWDSLSSLQLETYEGFLAALWSGIASELDIKNAGVGKSLPQGELAHLILQRVLSNNERRFSFVFDSVDRLMERGHDMEFLGMVKGWTDNRTHPLKPQWKRLDLVLAFSTAPYLVSERKFQAPFNVGESVELTPFSYDETQTLNEYYQQRLEDAELGQLWELVGGHPALTQRAYEFLVEPPSPEFDAFLHVATDAETGPFASQLSRLVDLTNDPTLKSKVLEILTNREIDDVTAERLRGAGFLTRAGGTRRMSNQLYERFLKRYLQVRP